MCIGTELISTAYKIMDGTDALEISSASFYAQGHNVLQHEEVAAKVTCAPRGE